MQIVDTTRYDPQVATEMTYKKIVLGAIDKDWDEEASTSTSEGQRSVLGHTPEPRYTPSIPQGRTPHDLMYPQVMRPTQRTELSRAIPVPQIYDLIIQHFDLTKPHCQRAEADSMYY